MLTTPCRGRGRARGCVRASNPGMMMATSKDDRPRALQARGQPSRRDLMMAIHHKLKNRAADSHARCRRRRLCADRVVMLTNGRSMAPLPPPARYWTWTGRERASMLATRPTVRRATRCSKSCTRGITRRRSKPRTSAMAFPRCDDLRGHVQVAWRACRWSRRKARSGCRGRQHPRPRQGGVGRSYLGAGKP